MDVTSYTDALISVAGLDFYKVRTRGSIPWVARPYFLALEVIFARSICRTVASLLQLAVRADSPAVVHTGGYP